MAAEYGGIGENGTLGDRRRTSLHSWENGRLGWVYGMILCFGRKR